MKNVTAPPPSTAFETFCIFLRCDHIGHNNFLGNRNVSVNE